MEQKKAERKDERKKGEPAPNGGKNWTETLSHLWQIMLQKAPSIGLALFLVNFGTKVVLLFFFCT